VGSVQSGYKSSEDRSSVQYLNENENKNENGTSPRQSRKKGSAEDCELL
jgi:hypothetical protein